VSFNSSLLAGTTTGYNNAQIIASTDDGGSWHLAKTGLNRVMDAFAASGQNLFLSLDDAGVYLSTDNGTTWSQTNTTVEPYAFSFVTMGSNLFVGTWYQGVYATTDNGASWARKDSGLANLMVNVLLASGSNLFAGTSGGGVYLTTNGGTSWAGVSSGIPAHYGYIDAMTSVGSVLFVGTYNIGVYTSTNNGASWTAARSGLPQLGVPYYKINAFASSGNSLFAGTYGGGVYLSTNFGTSWTSVNEGLSRLAIRTLAVKDGYLFAGGDSSGVWRRPLSEMPTGVTEAPGAVPSEYSLSQNYPNPFNPTTVVSYQLPVASNVKLAVYDVLGREVAVLVNGRMEAGTHEVIFNAAGLASGAYVYRLRAGSSAQTRKLMILK
jgi:photosystem II stability/assembly factor-like uncharacterized protein